MSDGQWRGVFLETLHTCQTEIARVVQGKGRRGKRVQRLRRITTACGAYPKGFFRLLLPLLFGCRRNGLVCAFVGTPLVRTQRRLQRTEEWLDRVCSRMHST